MAFKGLIICVVFWWAKWVGELGRVGGVVEHGARASVACGIIVILW